MKKVFLHPSKLLFITTKITTAPAGEHERTRDKTEGVVLSCDGTNGGATSDRARKSVAHPTSSPSADLRRSHMQVPTPTNFSLLCAFQCR
jgi:hypothetical protein